MKRLMSVVLSMVVVLMMCGGAMAEDFNAQGSYLIPHIKGLRNGKNGSYDVTRFYVSNITESAVQSKIIIYDQNGNDVSSYGDVYSPSGANWQHIIAGGNTFEIPAHSTRMFEFARDSVNERTIGYGLVLWKSSDPQKRKALVGSTEYYYMDGARGFGGAIYMNNGNPF